MKLAVVTKGPDEIYYGPLPLRVPKGGDIIYTGYSNSWSVVRNSYSYTWGFSNELDGVFKILEEYNET